MPAFRRQESFYEPSIELFIVTRYDKYMSQAAKKRGRPKKADAKSAAERMRAYRKRKRDAGLTSVRRWEPADGTALGSLFRSSNSRRSESGDALQDCAENFT